MRSFIHHISEFAICHVARHGNTNTKGLHCCISHSRGILNGIHVAMAYNVTNRKLLIYYHFPDNLFIIPNATESYRDLSPKHTAYGVAQSSKPIYRHGKACLSKQLPGHAAGDSRLARGRSWVSPPSLPLFCTFPTTPV